MNNMEMFLGAKPVKSNWIPGVEEFNRSPEMVAKYAMLDARRASR